LKDVLNQIGLKDITKWNPADEGLEGLQTLPNETLLNVLRV
jgi:hypothetical protein